MMRRSLLPLFALSGLYLLGKLKLGEEPAGEGEGKSPVGGVVAATAMFSLSIYLAAGLFNGRPFGGWIDGWLPPLEYPGDAQIASTQQATSLEESWSTVA